MSKSEGKPGASKKSGNKSVRPVAKPEAKKMPVKRRKLLRIAGVVAVVLAGVWGYLSYDAQLTIVKQIENSPVTATASEIHTKTQTEFDNLPFADDPYFTSKGFLAFQKLVAANQIAEIGSAEVKADRETVTTGLWFPGMRDRAATGYADRDAVAKALAEESARLGILQVAAGSCEHTDLTRKDFKATNLGETTKFNEKQSDVAFKVYSLAVKECD